MIRQTPLTDFIVDTPKQFCRQSARLNKVQFDSYTF